MGLLRDILVVGISHRVQEIIVFLISQFTFDDEK